MSPSSLRVSPPHPLALRVLLVLVAVFMVLSYLLWAAAETTTPGDALARAQQLYEQQEWEAAQKVLSPALKQEEFRDWAILLNAQLSEKRGALTEALSSFEAVSRQSAASIDARLGAIRVSRLLSRPPPERLADDLIEIEHALVRNRRQELLSDLLFERAKLLESQAQYPLAQTLLNELRDRFPRAAEQARKALLDLETAHPELVTEASAPTLLAEARLLAKEGEVTQALDRAALARSRLAAGSQAALEARLVEEKILRAAKRSEEADRALNEVASGAVPRIADEALLRLAKNAWNRNDHAEALQALSRLSSPRPLSPTLAEGLYTKGRIHEELKQFEEARQTYLAVVQFDGAVAEEERRRALRRVAWLSLLTSQWAQCADEFARLSALTESASPLSLAEKLVNPLPLGEEDRQARKLALSALDDRLHGMYWQSYCLTPDQTQQQRRSDLLVSLSTKDPRGYYGALARKALQSAGQAEIDTTSAPSCSIQPPTPLRDRIARFRAHSLGMIVEREVDWAFGDGDALPLSPAATQRDRLRREFARVQLFLDGGRTRRGLALAEERLSDLALLGETDCAAELSNLSYPLVYRELFDKQTEVPPSLLYAIARTESYFDPEAVSVVGAQGIVQLMPQTAKAEGLGAEEDIFSPAVNLRLGARHLRRLLQEHDSTPPFAIAAYNGGSTAVKRWRSRYPGVPLEQWVERIGFPETNRYVKRVLVAQERYRQLLGEPPLERTPFSAGPSAAGAAGTGSANR